MTGREVIHFDSHFQPPGLSQLDHVRRSAVGNQVIQPEGRLIRGQIVDVQQVVTSRCRFDLEAVFGRAGRRYRVQHFVESVRDDRIFGQLQVQGNESLRTAVDAELPLGAHPPVGKPRLQVAIVQPRIAAILLVAPASLVSAIGQLGVRRARLIDAVQDGPAVFSVGTHTGSLSPACLARKTFPSLVG